MIVDRRHQQGFTILEAAIAAFLFAFGLLGLVTVQTRAQAAEGDTLGRTQALLLVDAMAARMSANRTNASAYETSIPVGTGDSAPADCTTLAAGAARDLCDWSHELQGATEVLAGSQIGSAPKGRGCIEAIAGSTPPTWRISVAWQGSSPTIASSFACGQGLYGDDASRRVVATSISIASLAP